MASCIENTGVLGNTLAHAHLVYIFLKMGHSFVPLGKEKDTQTFHRLCEQYKGMQQAT
jgi:hypothetical protein